MCHAGHPPDDLTRQLVSLGFVDDPFQSRLLHLLVLDRY